MLMRAANAVQQLCSNFYVLSFIVSFTASFIAVVISLLALLLNDCRVLSLYTATYPADCWDYYRSDGEFRHRWSGIYAIFPPVLGKPTPMFVYCDMKAETINKKTYTGGWMASAQCSGS